MAQKAALRNGQTGQVFRLACLGKSRRRIAVISAGFRMREAATATGSKSRLPPTLPSSPGYPPYGEMAPPRLPLRTETLSLQSLRRFVRTTHAHTPAAPQVPAQITVDYASLVPISGNAASSPQSRRNRSTLFNSTAQTRACGVDCRRNNPAALMS